MIIAAVLGAVAGVLCGFVPGLHTNLIAGAVVLVGGDEWWWVVFLTAFAVARSIADAVPSVFLGASDDVLALHPAQLLLRKGKGLCAVKCSITGALLGLVASLLLAPLMWFLFPPIAGAIRPFLFWIVLAAVVWLVAKEEEWYWALLVFCACGVFGVLALDAVAEPLFPMLSGLFGASGILLSFSSRADVPMQEEHDRVLRSKVILPGAAFGVIAGCLLMLVPGLGPSQGAALVSGRRVGAEGFLVLTGALGTVDVSASLVAFAVLGKARNGAVVAVDSLVGALSGEMFAALIGAALLASGFAVCASLVCARAYARLFDVVDVRFIHCAVLGLLALGSFVLSGGLGLLVFAVGASLGVLAPLLGVSRSHAMACLLVPTLLRLW